MTDTDEIKKWEQNMLELKTPLLKFDKPPKQEVQQMSPKKKKKMS